MENEIVIGIEALKNKWRYAKVRSGDMRGLSRKSRFEIAATAGISAMQVAFDSIAPKSGKIEIEASLENEGKSWGSVYSLSDLLDEVKGCNGITIQLVKVQWNKEGTDANRNNIGNSFIYKNS